MATAHLEAVGVDIGRQSFKQVRTCRVRMLLLPLFTACLPVRTHIEAAGCHAEVRFEAAREV